MPGFFDREVFDVLDGKAVTKEASKRALVTVSADTKDDNDVVVMVGEAEEDGGYAEVDADVTFDSGRRATSYDGLFPDYDRMEEVEVGNGKGHDNPIPDPMPISGDFSYVLFHFCVVFFLCVGNSNSTSCYASEGCLDVHFGNDWYIIYFRTHI
ncbi:hypothetical protein Hdeb2414_s0521g00909931 [Helianthus debilis subsp. tardiflorus]